MNIPWRIALATLYPQFKDKDLLSSLIQYYKHGSDKQHATSVKRTINKTLPSAQNDGAESKTGSTPNCNGHTLNFDVNNGKKEAMAHFANFPSKSAKKRACGNKSRASRI
mmetsp:Transcript_9335/g.10046  ORF Transcript_9335/g.10046 Transcript_9335/m.10046 type:complete len:110 (+) Transcript_9335:196-525(+)